METEHFVVEEFLDFSNDDVKDDNALQLSRETMTFDNNNNNKVDDSVIMADESYSATENGDFSAEFCIPYDDFPELEWLSTLTEEESFSSEEDMEKLRLITGSYKFRSGLLNSSSCKGSHVLRPEVTVPAKARTKRPRPAPCNWSLPFLMAAASPPTADTESQRAKRASKKSFSGSDCGSGSDGRKCLHCASEKTPQWRTGPMGPKTLCNACGVRYKSGRLVPEYRPAASPTFVLTKHSNSHRKVVELRRHKDMMRPHQQQQHHFVHHSQITADGMDGQETG